MLMINQVVMAELVVERFSSLEKVCKIASSLAIMFF